LSTPDLDQLFTVPLNAFVAERKRLTAQLRAAGKPTEAKEVQKTPRPSASAWAVNQLARQEAPLLKRFAEITARLQAVPRSSASANSVEEPTEVLAAHRDTLRQLRDRAEKILAATGQAARPQILERVVRNLRLGLASQETRATIEVGRLVHDVAEQDFVSLLGQSNPIEIAADQPNPPRLRPPEKARRETPEPKVARVLARAAAKGARAEAARIRVESERARVERARARLESERRIRTLRGEADHARKALERAEVDRDKARQALAEAEDRVRQARLESERAAQALQVAQAAI
jgi:hypothetical protein